MIQSIIKGRAGSVETFFVSGPPTSCTASIYDGRGGQRLTDAACTIDTVSTTLSVAALAGDTSLTLASVAGLTNNRRYLIGAGNVNSEAVGIKSIAGLVVELWAPLEFDQAISTTFKGTRVSVATDTTVSTILWWDGYCVFTPNTGDEQTETVDCVRRKIPDKLIDQTDLRLIISKEQKALSSELDIWLAMQSARDQMLIDFGGKNRAQTILGADHFRMPCAMRFWLDRRYEFGEEWRAQMDLLQKDYEHQMDQIISQAPVDVDQDGVTNGPNDGGFTVIQLERA